MGQMTKTRRLSWKFGDSSQCNIYGVLGTPQEEQNNLSSQGPLVVAPGFYQNAVANRSKDCAMVERLVDVVRGDSAPLHTYPITIGDSENTPTEAEYKEKASQAAAYDQLVPDADLKTLTTRMHVCRGGPLARFGDDRGILSETKEGLDQFVRERAYFLWEQDGCPDGRAEEYWHRAHQQNLRERAYILWQQEGCPEGRSDEYWHRTCEFERY